MRLSGFKLPVEHFSATSLSKAVLCPEQYRRKYILKEREKRGIELFIGTVDHATMEENFNMKILSGVDMPEPLLLDRHRYLWTDTLATEPPEHWEEGEASEQLFDTSQLMALTYLREAAPYVDPIAVEQRFSERVKGVPVPIVGSIDVNTAPSLIERKTAKTKLSKPKPTWQLQGRIYQLMEPKPIEWHVTTKQKTPQVIRGGGELTMVASNPDHTVLMIQQTVQRINDLYERYGPNHPWPTDGMMHDWLCGFCQFGPRGANDCIAWSTTRGVI